MRLRQRLQALEERTVLSGPVRWVRVIQEVGQSLEDAISVFERERGLVCDARVIVRQVVDPVNQWGVLHAVS